MNIQGLDHYTLRSNKLQQTRDFYCRVVGLSEGYRPAFAFPGHWLYAADKPVLHLVAAEQDPALEAYLGQRRSTNGSGVVDHLAFRGADLSAMPHKLLALELHFRERQVPEILEHQLFLEDPNGITVEMIFPFSPDNKVLGEAMPKLRFR